MKVSDALIQVVGRALAALFVLGFGAGLLAEPPASPGRWPTYEEQLEQDCISPQSALAGVVAQNQEFWMLRDDEREDGLRIPPWLRVLYRKSHPEPRFVFSADDPTKGYPHVLKDNFRKLLDSQEDPSYVLRSVEEFTGAEDSSSRGEGAGPSPDASIGANLSMSGTQTSRRNESCVQVNYWNPNLILGASNESASPQAQFYSTDGGATWGRVDLPLLLGDTTHSDPWVDWTSDGVAWTCAMGCKAAKCYLRLYQSNDNGATWIFHSTLSGAQNGVDKQMGWVDHSACSPYADSMYFIWHDGNPAFVNTRRPGGAWGAPFQLSGAESTGTCIGGDIKTNAYGDVFAFWPTTGNRRIVLRKSTDGGTTWTPAQVVWTMYDAYDIGVPAMAVRRAMVYVAAGAYRTPSRNEVYLAWTDLSGETGCTQASNEPGTTVSSNCKSRIWFSRSADGGATWSAPVKINHQASRNDQFNPWLSVDETTGAIGISYNDSVADPGRLRTDIWFQSSTDGGVTWSAAQKVTTAMTDETGGGADTGMQYGDYSGLAGYAGLFFPSWTDRRSGGLEEIWTAKITDCVPPAAPSSPTFTGVTCNALTVNWPGASGASSYDVYRIPGNCAATPPLRVANGVTGTSFADSGLTPNTTYAYYITARNATCQRFACGTCAPVTTLASCSAANPKEASPAGSPLTASPSAGTSIQVNYTPACGATDHAIYWSRATGTIAGLTWANAACARGVTSPATFDPGPIAPGEFIHFVIVAQNGTKEGSYGQSFDGVTSTERAEATNAAWSCNLPQDLTGSCP